MTSQKTNVNCFLCNIAVPVAYDFHTSGSLDHAALMKYVYGPVQDATTALHATNHLLGAGLSGKIKINENLSGFLSPAAKAMKGR